MKRIILNIKNNFFSLSSMICMKINFFYFKISLIILIIISNLVLLPYTLPLLVYNLSILIIIFYYFEKKLKKELLIKEMISSKQPIDISLPLEKFIGEFLSMYQLNINKLN